MAPPTAKGKQQIGSGRIAKKQFGNRNRQIVFVDAHRAFGKDFGVERQIVLQMHGAFWMTGRAGSKQPDRDVVAMRIGGRAIVVCARHGAIKRRPRRNALVSEVSICRGSSFTDNQHRAQIVRIAAASLKVFSSDS